MANTQYALHLKGFVDGADFDRNYVDYVLAKHVCKPVNVLIDSPPSPSPYPSSPSSPTASF